MTALNTPPMVVEAETERAEVVAAVRERKPPPTALRMPLIVVEPVFEMEKSVVVENTPPALVDDEIAKRVIFVEDAFAASVRFAYGELVLIPTLPTFVILKRSSKLVPFVVLKAILEL